MAMEIAVLGTDPAVLQLAEAALQRGDRVVWMSDVRPADTEGWAKFWPHVREESAWEGVLDPGLADITILGAGQCSPDARLERLQRLIADALPTVATFPISTNVLPYFSLDIVRQDAKCPLWHFNPVCVPELNGLLAEWISNGHEFVGKIQHVAWQRLLPDARRQEVLGALAQDAESIAQAVGGITKVSALGPTVTDEEFARLNVQLVGPAELPVQWSVASGTCAPSSSLTLVGQRGQIDVTLNSLEMQPRVDISSSEVRDVSEDRLEAEPPAIALLEKIERVLREQDSADHGTWHVATRAAEVADAVELSLQKGRMIEIHHQQLTEQLAFRGVMSALGCGLLLVGLFVILLAGVLGDTLNIPLIGLWPFALVALMVVFLLLQLVPATASGAKSKRPQN